MDLNIILNALYLSGYTRRTLIQIVQKLYSREQLTVWIWELQSEGNVMFTNNKYPQMHWHYHFLTGLN